MYKNRKNAKNSIRSETKNKGEENFCKNEKAKKNERNE